mmetsp:Transcript_9866/g.15988  ORF Transcript_9866/g.15988 Transcript_9866/m.15988 type:complete len:321 (-) Transcript_9866:556-1518(-)|eukprot:CAMPEP_0194581004 /NCGR_PEP_ID=MMETSP0292-20121207/14596_1 /TAXON_ID=39354 /ORGANISM="Heterosigma akashiwo, Strain CCMP2393" /LENGTH=320 /DNA_ID=CAMNT_0039434573 /DNA_START=94 /DNA_END=1056 /DNA_ORIENTATION=-
MVVFSQRMDSFEQSLLCVDKLPLDSQSSFSLQDNEADKLKEAGQLGYGAVDIAPWGVLEDTKTGKRRTSETKSESIGDRKLTEQAAAETNQEDEVVDGVSAQEMQKLVKIDIQEEILAAITMLAPCLISWNFLRVNSDWYSFLVALHTFIHTPFSVLHHINLATNDPYRGNAGRGLVFRRLDYTFIQFSCFLLTYGLSRSEAWGLAAFLFNARAIYRIWTNPLRPQKPSHSDQGLGVLAYVGALLARGHVVEFALTFAAFVAAFAVYKHGRGKRSKGEPGDARTVHNYCHPAMHMLLAIPQFFMMVVQPDVAATWSEAWF